MIKSTSRDASGWDKGNLFRDCSLISRWALANGSIHRICWQSRGWRHAPNTFRLVSPRHWGLGLLPDLKLKRSGFES
jgi:hypothetical protein